MSAVRSRHRRRLSVAMLVGAFRVGTLWLAPDVSLAADNRLFWMVSPGSSVPDAVMTSSLDGGNPQVVYSVGTYRGAQGLAIDASEGRIYWSEFQGPMKGIRSCRMDGSDVQTVVESPGAILGIDIDAGAGKIYWGDRDLDHICRANLDGSSQEVLLSSGISNFGYIALDSADGKMYWTDWGNNTIKRANLDGSGVETLISAGLLKPFGIALTLETGKMYFCNYSASKIQRANLDGSQIEDVLTGLTEPSSVAVDLEAQKIYWTLWRGSDAFKPGAVYRENLDGTDTETLVPELYHPAALRIAVPEPTTLSLLALGGLALVRRRRSM